MRIGELARATGVSTRSLRYYEEQGLLPASRSTNGYRDYSEQAVQVVAFIQDLYRAGLPSEIIRQILPCAGSAEPQGDCGALLARVEQVRDQLAQQEQQLSLRREMLERYLSGAAAPAGLDAHQNSSS
ncbi:MerR family transcriptional regulator [Actinospica sp. MGRD01-02]|uniref:MerR family transcriptional regulator n=1 Tax=Actinospica acidithermotolerans TaxID=2828514 RepID=A0A941EB90_9ACTN|nr:MerR family transcriptional regulator [Actinospica acidithermotolerans]MBR7828321.1 MerR family transcriptional regulator [Actinospica acidithermotolerans]